MIDQHGTLEISAARLTHNVELFRRRLAGEEAPREGRTPAAICAAVKANAYGHGLAQMVPLLRAAGVEWTCVYALSEALDVLHAAEEKGEKPLQERGKDGRGLRVLALAPVVLTERAQIAGATLKALVHGQVRITLTDIDSAVRLGTMLAAMRVERSVRVHVQVDTGLTRAGASAAEAEGLIEAILGIGTLELEGVYSHLSHGDEPGHETVGRQLAALHAVADEVTQRRPGLLVHLQNSGGVWHVRDEGLGLVRVGIGLYGLQPSTDDPIADLRPIARLVAPVLAIHARPAGVGVGYGHTFTTQRTSRLAIVPVGYADGYPRALSNRGVVQVRGSMAPVVGRVSMDQIVVDVTDVPGAAVGDEVVVISDQAGQANSVDAIAQTCGTIGYEIATGFGGRLGRRVVG